MEKQSFPYFLNNSKYHALLVGLGVACIHFVVTYFDAGSIGDSTKNWCYQTLSNSAGTGIEDVSWRCGMIMGYIFFAPSYILILYANFRLDSNIIPFILATSLFYGSVASFLVSKNIILRVVGVVLIICLFCATGFGIMAVLSYSDA